MNRIYQGRVSKVQKLILGKNGKLPEDWEDFSKDSTEAKNLGEAALWKHHELFQDAVNYFLVALGALADSSSTNRLVHDLHARLLDSWSSFPRKVVGASSLRDSLRRTLPQLDENATLQDAFHLILTSSEATPKIRTLALALILAKCAGDAAIQQGGRAYLPRLCDAKSNPTWDYSASALQSGTGSLRLAAVLHSDSDQKELSSIASEMDLSWVVKVQPGKTYLGDEAKARLKEAILHLLKQLTNPSPRLAEALSTLKVDPQSVLHDHLKAIPTLPNDLTIPRNRKAAPDLTFAAIAFQHFPESVTQTFLKIGIKAPKATSKAASKASDDALFSSVGDDPIKLARGARGYVFPAFTALPAWSPLSAGEPVWKEFDIAAFKEALKSLNQFNQKTIEREEKLKATRQTLAYMLGESDELPKSTEGEGETRIPNRPGKDSRWPLIEKLEKELSINLNEGGWRLTRGSLRGLRDIIDLWNKKPSSTTEELQQVVKTYQADDKNKREIGSIQLFLLLAEECYRDLWRFDPPLVDEEEAEEAVGILSDTIKVHELKAELERFQEPIKLTPAEPLFSRRLFMFSDLTDKLAKVKFGEVESTQPEEKNHFVETAIAMRNGNELRETRSRIYFSAPRLHRDELLGGAETRWLQPMIAALGLDVPKWDTRFDSAVALMPDRLEDGSVRHLLNFPVNLDASWLHLALGKSALWRGQFNGTQDKNLHLHWPGTARDATRKNPWWQNPRFIKDGFTVIANDLGQRTAGAWSLLKVTAWKPKTKRPTHFIGHDGTREWFAEILNTGMYRLPGEDQQVQQNGTRIMEKSGQKGRSADALEYETASKLAKSLGCESVENWLGVWGEKSFPKLNDQIIKIASRRLTRLGTYHRWSCFSPENIADLKRDDAVKAQKVELEGYEDHQVSDWKALLENDQFALFRESAGHAFLAMRQQLESLLLELANRTVPLKGREWTWQNRPQSQYGDLVVEADSGNTPKIYGQRGLSMSRIEQLEELRRLFLRYNRSLDREPGIPAKFGRLDEGRDSGEPCQILLDKIDRLKEQRVNQTAHLILAQALGVTLRPHQTAPSERQKRDLHGEYEKIAGRDPVDFIVIEDLSRYLSSQGRAPSENSRLMKWAHRAVRDKLKMLAEEPFGIPVVETVPAYSSRFHAKNGQPGSRLYELPKLTDFQIQSLEKQAAKTESVERHRATAARALLEQFQLLTQANIERKILDKKPRSLYFPKAGGPLFLAAREGSPVQADLNAASNLGFRAIAAPDCIAIHRRVRAQKDKECYRPALGNAREKAAFTKESVIELRGKPSKKFASSASPNFFYEPDDLRLGNGDEIFDQATLNGHPLVSGVALWSVVNDAIFLRCVELNRQRIEKWGLADDILI